MSTELKGDVDSSLKGVRVRERLMLLHKTGEV